MILAASFSETFYSLKRIIIVNSKVKCELSNKQRRLSLMLTILFPYIKIKLSQLVEKYKLKEVDDCVPKSVIILIISFLIYIFLLK